MSGTQLEPGPRRRRTTGSWTRDLVSTAMRPEPIADSVVRREALTGPFTGPPTSAQLMALRHLEYIADVQDSAISTALVPLREGRRGALAAIRHNRTRLLAFAANGTFVFLAGLALQIALIRYAGMGHDSSYAIQTLVSVQLSFVLSRYLTWRNRDVSTLRSFARFNVHQLASTGLGIACYVGLERFGMNYVAANVAVTAVLTPVSFAASHNWSMSERSRSRVTLATLPWPLFAVLAIQALLSLRLIWSNTPYIDEATYLYAGSQELNHWIHGTPVEDYQLFLSGAPVVYPPIGAIANAIGGLAGARLLSLSFMMGTTSLLYAMTRRLFGMGPATLASGLFVALSGTQFLGALATYDPMALFLLALASYLVAGRRNVYDTLTDIACSSVIAAALLALANADKYATALWDPVVVGLAWCAPPTVGYPWRYGLGRALRFGTTLVMFLGIGLAVGKAKYIRGIMYTTVARSSTQIGMGQPASLVLHDSWLWIGAALTAAMVGAFLLLLIGRRFFPDAATGSIAALVAVLVFATIAAPANQARIGTTVSLQKHVIFGAWFGCILAGYAFSVVLRYRVLIAIAACGLLFGYTTFNMSQATNFYHWSSENPKFITALKKYVRPGGQAYLIQGYSDIPAYYAGYVRSVQWKEAGNFSYTDPKTGKAFTGEPALANAIRNREFEVVMLNFTSSAPGEPADDYAVVNAIARYGGYQIIGHLPPSSVGSKNYYTVWQRMARGK